MEITKQKLPQGLTYPLKSSQIQSACKYSGVELPITLRYETDADLFVAHYYFPATWKDYEHIVILSGSVKSHDSEEAREYVANRVVPDFIVWVNELINLPDNSSRFTGHNFVRWAAPQIVRE